MFIAREEEHRGRLYWSKDWKLPVCTRLSCIFFLSFFGLRCCQKTFLSAYLYECCNIVHARDWECILLYKRTDKCSQNAQEDRSIISQVDIIAQYEILNHWPSSVKPNKGYSRHSYASVYANSMIIGNWNGYFG